MAAQSLYQRYREEVERHKWIASEKAGRDLGEQAIRDWRDMYWREWCRARLAEHLAGTVCWRELGLDQFGILAC